MIRNDVIECFILGFGLEIPDNGVGRPTQLTPLWLAVQEKCGDCRVDEVLDAIYNLSEEHADLYRFAVGDAAPYLTTNFELMRRRPQWKEFFNREFRIRVLPPGRVRYQNLMDQLQREPSHAEPSAIPPQQPAQRRQIGFHP
jgi:hypothetical protein